MKAKISTSIIFLSWFVVGASASEQIPAAVSPGKEIGIAVIHDICPTFSWTAVEGAVAYRVEIFEATSDEGLSYKQTASLSYPVLTKEIQGAATSWTPSSDEPLSHNGVYIWFVQALNEYGGGAWSEGKVFHVNLDEVFSPIFERLGMALEAAGLKQESIPDVINNVRAEMKGGKTSLLGITPITIQGTEGAQDTFYGTNAGLSDTISSTFNSFFGANAGYSTSSGDQNSFIGSYAGYTNDGSGNSFLGHYAGRLNSTGDFNVFLGAHSGTVNTTGASNVIAGYTAGYSNTIGYENAFYGRNAGYSNISGNNNTYMGFRAGYLSTTANDATAIGHRAGNSNTATGNTFLGAYSGLNSSSGIDNTFLGYYSGGLNTTGQKNTAVGELAGYTNVTRDNNTSVGYRAGYSSTADGGTFLGSFAGTGTTSGEYNVFVGYLAGQNNTTGQHNTYIGRQTGLNNITGSYNVFLGSQAGTFETGSNKLYVDNSSSSSPLIWGDFNSDILAVNGQLGIGTMSPGFPIELERTGTNASLVVDRTDGATNYINATATSGNFGTVTNHVLRLAVNSMWRLRLHTDNSLTMKNGASCTAGGVWTDASSRELKENIQDLTAEEALETLQALDPVKYNYKADTEDSHIGFIAEDVPDSVASKDRKGMSPMDVVAVLTKVLQEQQKLIQEQQKTIAELKAEVEQLKYEREDL